MSSAIRALFLDIDGTLLDSHKQVPATALRAIQACRSRGIAVYAATGRAGDLDQQLASTWHPDLPMDGVFHNGACLRLGPHEDQLCLDPGEVNRIIQCCETDPELNISLQYGDWGIAFRHPLDPGQTQLWGIRDGGRAFLRPWPDMAPGACDGILKLMVFPRGPWGTQGDLTSLHRQLTESDSIRANLCLSDRGAIIQAMHPGANKRNGVERALAILGLAPESVAVVGDDTNDLEMLAAFPHSVAMGNAPAAVKAAARHVAPSHDADGLARAIELLLDAAF